MTEHKTKMSITETDKNKKLSSTFMTKQKTENNYTLVNQTINIQIQKRSNKPQNSLRKRLTITFNQQLASIHFLYP